ILRWGKKHWRLTSRLEQVFGQSLPCLEMTRGTFVTRRDSLTSRTLNLRRSNSFRPGIMCFIWANIGTLGEPSGPTDEHCPSSPFHDGTVIQWVTGKTITRSWLKQWE